MKLYKIRKQYEILQREIMRRNQDAVNHSNETMLYSMLHIGCVGFGVFFLFSLIIPTLHELTVAYLLLFVLLILLRVSARFLLCYVNAIAIIYFGYTAMVLYSTYASAFITPEFTCVIILFFLFQFPIVLLDQSWRINLCEVCFTVFYLVTALPYKDAVLRSDEIMNCVLFAIVGIVMGEYMRKAKIDNFELNRKALLRERQDYLTGLGNRRSLIECLEMMEDFRGTAILMLDVDDFKLYNDTYGHQRGDVCLKHVCDCLKDFGLRHHMNFYRYGGEEFVGIVHPCEQQDALWLCEEINTEIMNLGIAHRKSKKGVVTVSIGVAEYEEGKTLGYKQLLTQADIAVYKAKSTGKNRSVRYDDKLL